jgi:hypothetical protein
MARSIVVLAMLSILLSSGCVCLGKGNESVLEPVAQDRGTTSSTETTVMDIESTSTTEAVTVAVTTNLEVKIAGCDDDYNGNAMVGGYVTNTGSTQSGPYRVVVRLQDSSGTVVEGGEKRIKGESLNPGQSAKFSTYFDHPLAWKKCTASPEQ